MEIPVSVNNFAATATLDTGAEVNCIGQELLSQIPGSNLFVRPTQRHKGLQLASKQIVPVLECVQIPLRVGKKTMSIEFQVLAQSDLLLGLPALQELKTTIDFENNEILMKLYSVKVKIPEAQSFNMVLTNKKKFVLRPGQTKNVAFSVKSCSEKVANAEVIEVQSHRCHDPVILPSICIVDMESCTVPVRNTGKKKIKYSIGTCIGVGRVFDTEKFKIERVTEQNLFEKTISEYGLGKLENEKAGMNSAFYAQETPSVRKLQIDSTEGFEGDPLFELEELPLGCPDRPREDFEELLEEQLDQDIPYEHRERLKNIFENTNRSSPPTSLTPEI